MDTGNEIDWWGVPAQLKIKGAAPHEITLLDCVVRYQELEEPEKKASVIFYARLTEDPYLASLRVALRAKDIARLIGRWPL